MERPTAASHREVSCVRDEDIKSTRVIVNGKPIGNDVPDSGIPFHRLLEPAARTTRYECSPCRWVIWAG